MISSVTVLVFVAVFLVSFLALRRRKGLPPGPFISLPIVGSVFFLKELQKKRVHISLLDASQRYGKIFSFWIGEKFVVVLTGFDAIQAALVKHSHTFSDRPSIPGFQTSASSGIILRPYNKGWKSIRRFTLQTLRDFGVGKTSLEEKIVMELDAACDAIGEYAGEPLEIRPVMQKITGNVLYSIVFGKRFDFNDPDFQIINRMTNISFQGGPLSSTRYLPNWVTRIIAKAAHAKIKVMRKNFDEINDFINAQIKQHEETFAESCIRDFVDLFIDVSRRSNADEAYVYTKESMFQIILELFLVGSETTYNTLDWAFLYMSEYPEIQEKCFNEINDTLGDKRATYADRTKLRYVTATILEIQRLGNIVPLATVHATSEDTNLLGYFIPKGTLVFPNLYSALMDPKHWDEPESFKPERFLDPDGNVEESLAHIPFGTGPRSCLGEPLARMELFLVFANLIQKYKFARENEKLIHSMAVRDNQITNAPVSYKLKVTKRFN